MLDGYPAVSMLLSTLSSLGLGDVEVAALMRATFKETLLRADPAKRARAEDGIRAKLLRAVSTRPGRRSTEIVESLKVQRGAAFRQLRLLLEAGKVEARGPKAERRYYPVD